MSIQTNIAKIYLKLDRTVKKVIDPFISRGANNTVQIMLVAPFNIQNSQYVNFELESSIDVPTRYMTLVGTENSVDTDNEDWGVWVYSISEKILAGAAANASSILNVTFSEFRNTTSPSSYEFIGFQSTEAALNANFPTPTNDQYAGVGNGTTLGTATCYLAVNGTWVNQNKTVLQFESDNSILRQSFIGESNPEPLSVDPNISTINDETDNTNLDIVFVNISDLQGRTLTIETLLGVDGENFVKSALASEYQPTSTPEGADQLYIEKENGDKRRVSFADLAAGARDNFIGTFATASGLTCPDPDDLICTYPNGIADPNDRLGWVANVTATNSLWRWITASNEWQDTGEAPTLAKDIGYDPASDPSTGETNVQDGMVEHGSKINVNKVDLDAQKLKTQKFNSSGDIAEDIEIITTKDISSPDLDTGTSSTYQKIIQAIIGEFGRNNAQDILISDNASAIADRLVKNFSTLLNKSTPDNADLLVLWDGAANKNISYQELVAAIETQIQFYQGYFVDLAALETAIPVGQAGWYATLGDVDTQAVWDVEGAGWVGVASKLYFTQTAGNALEVRITTLEGNIVTINAALLTKEDLANKSSNVGDLGDTTKYPSWKGIENYVEPIRITNDEDRTHVEFLQLPTTTKFQSNLNDSSLFEGRILYARIDTIVIQAGVVQISIDGGSTFKNLAAFEPGSGLFFDFDLSVNNVFGRYITVVFYAAIDKWVIYDTNENLARIVGVGWSLDVTLMGEKLRNDNQNTRLDNIEAASIEGAIEITQGVKPTTPITAQIVAGFHKVVFNEEIIESDDRNVIDIDGQYDIVLKEADISVYTPSGRFKITNNGSLNSTSTITFYLFKKGDLIQLGNELDTVTVTVTGQNNINDRSVSLPISNDFIIANLGGFPVGFEVYYTNDTLNPTTIDDAFFYTQAIVATEGVSSSANNVLTNPLTETRGGVATKQNEHNEESVEDRKNLLEAGKAVIAIYQSAGQYMANKTEIVLDTNKIVRVLFSGEGTDLTELVELSLDNGVTYYDVEYRLTDVDLTVKNATTHVMDLYFTGIKFIATYVDSPIENQDLPYVGLDGQFEIPKNGVAVYIGEETTEKIKKYKGGTLNQLLIDGDDFETSWNLSNATGSITTGIYSFTATAQDGGLSTSQYLISDKTYILFARVKADSSDVKMNISGVGVVSHSGSGEYETMKSLITWPSASTGTWNPKVQDTRASGWTQVDVDWVMLIPVDNTFLDGLTADEIEDMLTYFEGLESVGSPFEITQEIVNGDSELEYTPGGAGNRMMLEPDGQIVVNNAYNTAYQNFSIVSGNKYFMKAVMSETVLDGRMGFVYSDASSQTVGSAVSGLRETYQVFEANATLQANVFVLDNTVSNTINSKLLYFVLIDLTDTPLMNISDEELNNMFDPDGRYPYKEGTFEIGGVFIHSVGKNKFDILNAKTISGKLAIEVLNNTDFTISGIASDSTVSVFPDMKWITNQQYIFTGTSQEETANTNARLDIHYTDGTSDAIFVPTTSEVAFDTTSDSGKTIDYIGYTYGVTGEITTIKNFMIRLAEITDDTYEDFIEANAHIDGELRGLDSVEDDLDFQRFDRDYNDVVQSATTWLIRSALTNTHTFRKVLDTSLDFIIPSSSGVPNVLLKINGITYPTKSLNAETTEDEIAVSIQGGGYVCVRVNSTTYPDTASFEALLNAGNVEFIFEIDEYLPRNEVNNNVIKVYGNIITGPGYTYTQKSSSGITNEFSATTAVNTKSQTKLNTDAIVDLFKALLNLDITVNEFVAKLNTLIDEVGLIPIVNELNDLSDVDTSTTAPVINDLLVHNGTKFLPTDEIKLTSLEVDSGSGTKISGFVGNARNRIWALELGHTYGESWLAGSAGYGGIDTISFHMISAAPDNTNGMFYIQNNGNVRANADLFANYVDKVWHAGNLPVNDVTIAYGTNITDVGDTKAKVFGTQVTITGQFLAGGAISSGAVLATVQSGYRPAGAVYCVASIDNSTFVNLTLLDTGEIRIDSALVNTETLLFTITYLI